MNPRRAEQRGGCGATLSWLSENTVEVLRKEVFVEKMGNILEDYGEIESLVLCPYKSKGIKVDAYH